MIFGRAVFTPVVEVATVTVTITGVNDAAVISAIGQVDVAKTTDTSAIAATIAVTFTDADLSDVGHTATLTSTGAAGTVAGLGLTTAELAALITPGAVTKVAGAANGTVTLGFSAASTAFDNLQSGVTLTDVDVDPVIATNSASSGQLDAVSSGGDVDGLCGRSSGGLGRSGHRAGRHHGCGRHADRGQRPQYAERRYRG